jgi:hypothetical protein
MTLDIYACLFAFGWAKIERDSDFASRHQSSRKQTSHRFGRGRLVAEQVLVAKIKSGFGGNTGR